MRNSVIMETVHVGECSVEFNFTEGSNLMALIGVKKILTQAYAGEKTVDLLESLWDNGAAGEERIYAPFSNV